ncbi:MAG: hypothetical protein ABR906_10630 [Terracidiphilus sp.]|jgi:hypothetical protein
MSPRNFVVAVFLIVLNTCIHGQQRQQYVLLPSTETNNLANMFPKDGQEKIDGSWQPTKSQIETLETNITRISDLRSFGAPKGEKIEHPENYFRQYLAVVRAGKNLIYVNALCEVQYNIDWRNHVAIVWDGGNCYWQAWYDPATEKFSNLYINGRA